MQVQINEGSSAARRSPPRPGSREHGAALMIMLLILILGAAALFARNLAGAASATARIRDSARALASAKEALLGYALTYDATHPGEFGFLPCPDIDNTGTSAEGEAHTTACLAQYQNVMGRLPWKTLGIAPARGGAGECLWYAVSGLWKGSSSTKSDLLNTDSDGQFRIMGSDGTTLIAGATAADRAVAVIVAPGSALAGQLHTTLGTGVAQCGGNYTAANYLDTDAVSGIDNSALATVADAVDSLIVSDPSRDDLNDQVIFITRGEIEDRLMRRPDVQTRLVSLTQAAAMCIADYGKRNPGGAGDRRLPWPAPVDLLEYRSDVLYDDTSVGWLSGRVADVVNDSNLQTGNTVARVLTNCNTATVPEWTPEIATLWRNWKDHLFYAVAGSFRPDASPHSTCGTCLSVNGAGTWAAVVIFSGARLMGLGQVRDEPPTDADTRSAIANYLEGRNATNHPNTAGNADYQSGAATATFTDVLYCIDPTLSIAAC